MATLVLGAVGSFFGGPIGGALGSAAGAYIDNKYLFKQEETPEAQKQPFIGPKLSGIQIQSAIEGAGMQFAAGPENRYAGQIIWNPGIIEQQDSVFAETTESGSFSGNKFITNSSSTFQKEHISFSYFLNLAIGLGEGEFEAIDRIVANGNTIFENPELTLITSTFLRAESVAIGGSNFVKVIATVASGIDLTVFDSGKEVNMSGWVTSILNDDWIVSESGTDPSTFETFVTLQHPQQVVGSEIAGANVTLDQTNEAFDIRQIADVRFFPGDLDQLPDPLIEATEDPTSIGGIVPAFRGTSYIVLERLALAPFGNQPPQMQFFVRESTTITVGATISKVLLRAGLVAADFDVTAATDNMRGLHFISPQNAITILEPLMKFGNLVATERNGVLIFRKIDDQTIQVVDENDLAAYPGRQVPAQTPFEITDSFGADLPAEIGIKFIEPDIGLQEGFQRERRIDVPNRTNLIFNIPITMAADKAREIARRELWKAWRRRRVISWSLPVSYMDLEENDYVQFPFEDEVYVIFIKKIDRGSDHVLQFEGVVEAVRANTQVGEVSDPSVTTDRAVFRGGTLLFEIIDIAPLTNDVAEIPGAYFAIAKIDPSADFSTANLFKSTNGQDFFNLDIFTQESTMGFVPSPLATGPVNYFDLGTSVDVVLVQGALQSITEEQLLAGGNKCIIGNEVLQFQNAVLIDTDTYTLTKFIRGIRDTSDKTVHTVDDERFILLDGTPKFLEIDSEEIGFDRFYKAIPPNIPEGQVPAQALEPVGANTVQAFTPAHLAGFRNSSNDLNITWTRVSRANVKHFTGTNTTPMLENRERFLFEFFDPTFTTVVDTVTVEGPWGRSRFPEFIYTAAAQTAAGLAPGADINFIIYQLTEIKNRGKGRAATL